MLANPMSIVPLALAALDVGGDAFGAAVVAVEEPLLLPQAATPKSVMVTARPTAARRLVFIYRSPFVRWPVEAKSLRRALWPQT
jgi:hypothetical protein